MYRILDLFAGAGGLSLGFTQNGQFNVAVAVENNPNAQATYRLNHKETIMLDDIREINDYDNFQARFGNFDVIIGGPPCQGFSNANRQKKHIISQNNSLIKKYVEVIDRLSPKVFVMENVRMLRSDTHRFYQSRTDLEATANLNFQIRKDKLCLYKGRCNIEGILDIIINMNTLHEVMLPEKLIQSIRILLKNSKDSDKQAAFIKNKGKYIANSINAFRSMQKDAPSKYRKFAISALKYIEDYALGRVDFNDIESIFIEYVQIQQLFNAAKELLDNEIIVDRFEFDDSGIHAIVHSYSVVDYINHKLGTKFLIVDGILNSAWFGVPQLRERYIAIGINKSICNSEVTPQLPEPKFQPKDYKTVWDAIIDIEDMQPNFKIEDPPIKMKLNPIKTSSITKVLRDSNELFNHTITETRENALKRFKALGQGQNFHDLDRSLIDNTYTKPDRTQNSIYLRLSYNNPSNTVTNVRKSMWIHPKHNRAISIREAARLQSFPDSFVFVGSKDSQYQQVGNAVPPMMAKAIAQKVGDLLDKCREVK